MLQPRELQAVFEKHKYATQIVNGATVWVRESQSVSINADGLIRCRLGPIYGFTNQAIVLRGAPVTDELVGWLATLRSGDVRKPAFRTALFQPSQLCEDVTWACNQGAAMRLPVERLLWTHPLSIRRGALVVVDSAVFLATTDGELSVLQDDRWHFVGKLFDPDKVPAAVAGWDDGQRTATFAAIFGATLVLTSLSNGLQTSVKLSLTESISPHFAKGVRHPVTGERIVSDIFEGGARTYVIACGTIRIVDATATLYWIGYDHTNNSIVGKGSLNSIQDPDRIELLMLCNDGWAQAGIQPTVLPRFPTYREGRLVGATSDYITDKGGNLQHALCVQDEDGNKLGPYAGDLAMRPSGYGALLCASIGSDVIVVGQRSSTVAAAMHDPHLPPSFTLRIGREAVVLAARWVTLEDVHNALPSHINIGARTITIRDINENSQRDILALIDIDDTSTSIRYWVRVEVVAAAHRLSPERVGAFLAALRSQWSDTLQRWLAADNYSLPLFGSVLDVVVLLTREHFAGYLGTMIPKDMMLRAHLQMPAVRSLLEANLPIIKRLLDQYEQPTSAPRELRWDGERGMFFADRQLCIALLLIDYDGYAITSIVEADVAVADVGSCRFIDMYLLLQEWLTDLLPQWLLDAPRHPALVSFTCARAFSAEQEGNTLRRRLERRPDLRGADVKEFLESQNPEVCSLLTELRRRGAKVDFGPVSSTEDVNDFELKIGFALPSEYREFLLAFGSLRIDMGRTWFFYGIKDGISARANYLESRKNFRNADNTYAAQRFIILADEGGFSEGLSVTASGTVYDADLNALLMIDRGQYRREDLLDASFYWTELIEQLSRIVQRC
jgi:hypothetical protein